MGPPDLHKLLSCIISSSTLTQAQPRLHYSNNTLTTKVTVEPAKEMKLKARTLIII